LLKPAARQRLVAVQGKLDLGLEATEPARSRVVFCAHIAQFGAVEIPQQCVSCRQNETYLRREWRMGLTESDCSLGQFGGLGSGTDDGNHAAAVRVLE
jgi:hypothetical protein